MEDFIKYCNLSFEELLADDFFVSSNLFPTEESNIFWNTFEQENKGSLENYFMAKRSLSELNRGLLDDGSVAKMWDNIMAANRRAKNLKTRKYYRIGWAAAAACIAALLTFRIFLWQPQSAQERPDIIAFANSGIVVSDSTITQLILSDNQIVSLLEQEAVIVYDSLSIKLTSQEIAMNETSPFHQLVVPKGKRLFLTLSDGTKIWVNSGSKLIYPAEFEQNKREIYIDGEVYLDVAHRGNQPFIVRTNDMDVRVLGTQFNVEAYGGEMQKRVVLKSGVVTVLSGQGGETTLKPNEMFERIENRETVTQVNVDKYISWMDGLYIYDNERLDVIFARLSRYYGKIITVCEKSAGFRCTGKIDLKDNLEDVLNIITFVAPVNYTLNDNTYSITYNNL